MKSSLARVDPDTPNLSVPEEAIEVLARDFEVTASTRLLVNVPRANVQLRPGTDRRIEIRIYMAGCDKDAAYAYMDDMGLRTRHTDDIVRVKPDLTPQDDTDWWRRRRAHTGTMYVDLRLPRRCHADIQAAAGTIEAADLSGKLSLEINAGTLRGHALNGQLEVFARGSTVELSDLQGKSAALHIYASTLRLDRAHVDTLQLDAAGSPVSLQQLHGDTHLALHGGSLQVAGVHDRLRAAVFGGPLTLQAFEDAQLDLTASGGDITCTISPSTRGDISLRGNDIYLDDRLPFDGEQDATRLEGQLNGGGATVLRARAYRGRIHCERA